MSLPPQETGYSALEVDLYLKSLDLQDQITELTMVSNYWKEKYRTEIMPLRDEFDRAVERGVENYVKENVVTVLYRDED